MIVLHVNLARAQWHFFHQPTQISSFLPSLAGTMRVINSRNSPIGADLQSLIDCSYSFMGSICLQRRTLGYTINKQKHQQSEQTAWGWACSWTLWSSWEQAHTAGEEGSLARSPPLCLPFLQLTSAPHWLNTKMWLIKYHARDFMPNYLNSLRLIFKKTVEK